MHCLTQTNKLTESRTHTNLVKEKLPPQNLQYLRREKTKKDVALIPKGMVGTAAYRHQKEENSKSKDHTYHKRCHQFLYKHNPHFPTWFPTSSAQSSMEYPLKQTTCMSRFNYLHGKGCVCMCVHSYKLQLQPL